jgi:hypothetical protein
MQMSALQPVDMQTGAPHARIRDPDFFTASRSWTVLTCAPNAQIFLTNGTLAAIARARELSPCL